MSLFRRDIVGIGLSPHATAGAAKAAAGVAHPHVVTHLADGSAEHQCVKAMGTIREAISASGGKARRHCRVVLTGAWAREWVMRAPGGLNSLTELRDLAAARFTQLFDEAAAPWLITGDWRSDGPMLCGAIPRPLHDAVTADLAKHGSTADFTTFASLCVRAAAVWREPGWWCIKCPESFILAVAQSRTLALLRTLPMPPCEQDNEPLARMAAEATRAALREGIAAPRTIHYVNLTGQSPMHTRAFGAVEFRARPPALSPRLDATIERDVALAACLEAQR